jgi:hypothetical protein
MRPGLEADGKIVALVSHGTRPNGQRRDGGALSEGREDRDTGFNLAIFSAMSWKAV